LAGAGKGKNVSMAALEYKPIQEIQLTAARSGFTSVEMRPNPRNEMRFASSGTKTALVNSL
jgi:hypothetical protein